MRDRRWSRVPVLAVTWVVLTAGVVRAQVVSDTLWPAADLTVPGLAPPIVLRLHTDTIGVVPAPGLDGGRAASLRDSMALRGARYERSLPGGIQLFSYDRAVLPGGGAARDSAFGRARRFRAELRGYILQAGPTATSPAFGGEARVATDEVVIRFAAGVDRQTVSARIASVGGRIVFFNPYVANEVLAQALNGDGVLLARLALRLADVVRSSANLRVDARDADAAGADYDPVHQWHLDWVVARKAWAGAAGGPGVPVAVLEVGPAYDLVHPDLQPRIQLNAPPWDFTGCQSLATAAGLAGQTACWTPLASGTGVHSTGVAGLAAADRNGYGVVGTCPRCGLLLLLEQGSNPYAKEIAIRHAAAQGARVLNASFESRGEALGLVAAIEAASAKVAFIVAAGNLNRTCGDWDVLGAEGTTVVGATDERDQRTRRDDGVPHGVSGPCLAGVAPGWRLKTAAPGGGAGDLSGTSSAAPVVAGIAGLMVASNPALTGGEVRRDLVASADAITTGEAAYAGGHDDDYGAGLVNACAAVRLASGIQEWRDGCEREGGRCPWWLFVLVAVVVFLLTFFVWPGPLLDGVVRWLVSLGIAVVVVLVVWLLCRSLG